MKPPKSRVARFSAQSGKKRRCRFCGCTEATPCAGGCAWAEDEVCSRCARIFISGELAALSNLAHGLTDSNEPSIDAASLIEELTTSCESLAYQIARLSANWPDAMEGSGDTIPLAAGDEFGKGVRSSDGIERARGAS